MPVAAKNHGFTLMALGTVVLFVTTLYIPYLYQNSPYYFELTWFVLLPIGLVLFVLGVFRLLVNAVLAISKKLNSSHG